MKILVKVIEQHDHSIVHYECYVSAVPRQYDTIHIPGHSFKDVLGVEFDLENDIVFIEIKGMVR